jgi:hypothetical protein
LIRGVEAVLMNALYRGSGGSVAARRVTARRSREVRDLREPQAVLLHEVDEESGGLVKDSSSVGLTNDRVSRRKNIVDR